MSHRDMVEAAPPGFRGHRLAPRRQALPRCRIPRAGLSGVQFHPEVVHTDVGQADSRELRLRHLRMRAGLGYPERRIGRCSKSRSANTAGNRNVFFFVSGGVDSTVAYTLCLRALGPDRVYGIYVDTGLMRQDETDFVREHLRGAGRDGLSCR